MKVALVHDWLTVIGGAERVLKEFLALFPDADVFTVVDYLNERDRLFLNGKVATTSFIQRLPFSNRKYRNYLPLMPIAIEQFDLSDYDLVISSSYAVAKGVITGPSQIHIGYVHSPMRYAWDLQAQYLKESNLERGFKGAIARAILHYLRIWDYRTSAGVDVMLANSKFVAKRIKKVYGRDVGVLYPPVDISLFEVSFTKEDFFLTASRLVPYKKVPLIVEAFAKMPSRRLVVIGDGPDMGRVREVASENVTILGYQSDEVLVDYLRRAKAFVFAAEEDFGIAPLEAQACGTPVIAYGKGGALETVRGAVGNGSTGLFFEAQTIESIVDAVNRFDRVEILADDCRKNAERFSSVTFREKVSEIVRSAGLGLA